LSTVSHLLCAVAFARDVRTPHLQASAPAGVGTTGDISPIAGLSGSFAPTLRGFALNFAPIYGALTIGNKMSSFGWGEFEQWPEA
jgi:hypothetical protein